MSAKCASAGGATGADANPSLPASPTNSAANQPGGGQPQTGNNGGAVGDGGNAPNGLLSACGGPLNVDCVRYYNRFFEGRLVQWDQQNPDGFAYTVRIAMCPSGSASFVAVARNGSGGARPQFVATELVQPGEQLLFEAVTSYDGDTWSIENAGGDNLMIDVRFGASSPNAPTFVGHNVQLLINIDAAGNLYLNGRPTQVFTAIGDICYW